MSDTLARALHADKYHGMNRTEAAYAGTLEVGKMVGEIKSWRFQAMTLKLADDTRYTPDFMVVRPDDTIEFHEVKGFWRDDARVKIRVAADFFPLFRFVAVRKVKCSWEYEWFGPHKQFRKGQAHGEASTVHLPKRVRRTNPVPRDGQPRMPGPAVAAGTDGPGGQGQEGGAAGEHQ